MDLGVTQKSIGEGITRVTFNYRWHTITGMFTQTEKDGRSWREHEELFKRASCGLHLSLVRLFFGIDYDEMFFKRIGNDKPALPREGGSSEHVTSGM